MLRTAAWLSVVTALAGFAPAAPQAVPDLHRTDFRNFTYQPSCADFEADEAKVPVRVEAGRFYGKEGTPTEGTFFEIREVLYGDLTGDGKDEAVVRTICNLGGTGQFDEGFVYGMRDGKPALLGRIPGGDRAAGGVRCVRFEDGALKVERLGNDTGAAAGVDWIETETWRLSNGGLAEAGKAVRRRLETREGARPIRFAKGKSSAVLKGKTSGADEYVFRAREGQTMTAKVSSPGGNAAFEIMIDDYTLACRSTAWTGELSEGEHRLRVLATRGTADYELELSIR
jgi:hypothetical protein